MLHPTEVGDSDRRICLTRPYLGFMYQAQDRFGNPRTRDALTRQKSEAAFAERAYSRHAFGRANEC